MNTIIASARAHIAKLEARIKQQTTVIEQLEKAGKDASEAIHTLSILQSALEEMRLQIRLLVPREPQPASNGRGSRRRRVPRKK